MSIYETLVVTNFLSDRNQAYLRSALLQRGGPQCVAGLFGRMVSFSRVIASEVHGSDPLPGITAAAQLNSYNEQFIRATLAEFSDEAPAHYMISDGYSNSASTDAAYAKSADDLLDTWKGRVGRGRQFREDPQSDIKLGKNYGGGSSSAPGVEIADYSAYGTSHHVDMYEDTFYKNRLNQVAPSDAHMEYAFGVSNDATDARLLSRRVFRANSAGVENGIPLYEQRLYRRNLDRDICESLGGVERDSHSRMFDMGPLTARINARANPGYYSQIGR